MSERLLATTGTCPAHRPPLADRPDVRDASLDLDPARPPGPGLMHDGDQPILVLDDLLWLDPKVLEALQPGAQEALKRLAPLVDPTLGGSGSLFPFDLWVKQRANLGQVPSVESVIATAQCLDISLGHTGIMTGSDHRAG